MQKKEYTTPDCQVVKVDTRTALLAGSPLTVTYTSGDELDTGYGD